MTKYNDFLLCTQCGYEDYDDAFFMDPEGTAPMELYERPEELYKCPTCGSNAEHIINADDMLKARQFLSLKQRAKRFFNYWMEKASIATGLRLPKIRS